MAKCGNCGDTAATVAQIRACYAAALNLPTVGLAFDGDQPVTPAASTWLERPTPEITEGLWKLGGSIYKVQKSRESGRLYGKVLVESAQAFEYAPGALRTLAQGYAVPLPAEDAARFGQLYGMCVACSRTLTDERSIHVGYGPVCAEKHGWPWGELPTIEAAAPVETCGRHWADGWSGTHYCDNAKGECTGFPHRCQCGQTSDEGKAASLAKYAGTVVR